MNKNNKRRNNIIKVIEGDIVSIPNFLILIARQMKIITLTIFLFSIASIIYVQFFTTDLFQSVSKVKSESANNSRGSGIAAQFGINLSSDKPEINWVYPEFVKSQLIARSVLLREFDTEKFEGNKKLFQILLSNFNLVDLKDNKNFSEAYDQLVSMIDISENEKNGIHTITITSFEPKLASDVNKALIEEIDLHQKKYNKNKTSKARQFISERIVDIERELLLAEEKLKEFRASNRRIQNSPTLLLGEQRLQREATVLTGVYTTLKQQLETTKIEEVKESDFLIIVDPPTIPLIKSWPRKTSIVLMYSFLGLFVGVCLALFREYIFHLDSGTKNKFYLIKRLVIDNITDLNPIKK